MGAVPERIYRELVALLQRKLGFKFVIIGAPGGKIQEATITYTVPAEEGPEKKACEKPKSP